MSYSDSCTKVFNYWRFRTMYSIIIGYAAFYLVRQNFSFALPALYSDLGYTKAQIGTAITVGAVLYGVGKCLFGYVGDRYSARYIMVIGLFMSAVMNICLGFSCAIPSFVIFCALNNCFQSMGWPPCAKLLTHWFSPVEIGTRWALWNTSQQIGGTAAMLLSAFLISHFSWRYVFFVPGIIAAILAVFLFNRLRDTPESLNLPSVEKMTGFVSAAEHSKKWETTTEENITYIATLKMALANKKVWYVGMANFFVYVCRMTFFYWGPTFLLESKGSTVAGAGVQMAMYDIAGMFGGVFAGYLSDKVFKGRRGPVGALCMIILAIMIGLLLVSGKENHILNTICMIVVGFLVTGPQILVGVAASDFASKKAAATASGFTGALGYAGSALVGGVGFVADNYGWKMVFVVAIMSAIISAVFFALTWNAKSKILEDKENYEQKG